MNFIPPACFQDNGPAVKYMPQEDKPAEPKSAPKLKRKKSLVSLWSESSCSLYFAEC